MTRACMHTYCGSPQIPETATQDTLCSHRTNLTSREYSHGILGYACFVRSWDYTIAIVCTNYTPCPVTSFLGHLRKPGGAEGEPAQERSFLCAGSKTEEGARKPEAAGGHMMPAQASDASCRAENLCLS